MDKREEEAGEHERPKKFEESSKSMEADAITKMTEDAFRYCCFVIDVIVSNEYRTMQVVIKHT